MSCSVVPGERAISSAVMTLVEAPAIPVSVRLAQTSIAGSTSVVLCACAAVAAKPASATSAPQILRFIPMTQRSFVCAREWRRIG